MTWVGRGWRGGVFGVGAGGQGWAARLPAARRHTRLTADPCCHLSPRFTVMSANEHSDTVFECIRAGAEDYLLKPVGRKEVQHIWQHVWRRRGLAGGRAVPGRGNEVRGGGCGGGGKGVGWEWGGWGREWGGGGRRRAGVGRRWAGRAARPRDAL